MEKNFDIQNKLKLKLSEYRYYHTLGVSNTAACLAMRFGAAIESAILAGLLHDCAKYMSDKALFLFSKEKKIPITQVEEESPHLLHAKVGAYLAKTEYNITEDEILNAILFHTTGKPEMAQLEQILFVADYIEPMRSGLGGLAEIRKKAFRDLNEATYLILHDTIKHLEKKQVLMDPATKDTYRYYKKLVKL